MSVSKYNNNNNHSKPTTTSKSIKTLSTTKTENKFELIDASEHLELIGKLSEQTGHSNRELNNNSISPASTIEGSGLFSGCRMDSKRKSLNESKQPAATTTAIEKNDDCKLSSFEQVIKHQQEESVLQIPSYSSIFASSSYSKPPSQQHQQQQQNSYRQLPIKNDQISYRDQEENQIAANNSTNRVSGKKFASLKYNCDKNKNENLELEDELDEGDIDEKMPFNNTKYCSNSKRISPGEPQRCQSPSNKQPIFAFNHRCDLDHQQNPHTKISIHDSRLPALSLCQAGYNPIHNETYPNRKMYLPEQPSCYRSDCIDCHRKLKSTSAMLDSGSNRSPESYSKSHSRTKSMHLVLKSIILVLLTILLLMLFIGIILATHYLPQVFDRVLNASRSFNVTIAG